MGRSIENPIHQIRLLVQLNFVFDNNITLESLKILINQITQQLKDNTTIKSQRSKISTRFVNPLSKRGTRTRTGSLKTRKYFSDTTDFPRTRFASNILSQTTGFMNPLQTLRVAAGIKNKPRRYKKRTRTRTRMF